MFQSLRNLFEAKLNRGTLNLLLTAENAPVVASGVLLFMGHRKLFERDYGGDYLAALPLVPPEELNQLLLILKGGHVKTRVVERLMKRYHGSRFSAHSVGDVSPLALRVAFSISVLMVSAHMYPTSRQASAQVLCAVLRLVKARLAKAREELGVEPVWGIAYEELYGREVEDIVAYAQALTDAELARPFGPEPLWLVHELEALKRTAASRP
jgi:hypothetical protein